MWICSLNGLYLICASAVAASTNANAEAERRREIDKTARSKSKYVASCALPRFFFALCVYPR